MVARWCGFGFDKAKRSVLLSSPWVYRRGESFWIQTHHFCMIRRISGDAAEVPSGKGGPLGTCGSSGEKNELQSAGNENEVL